MHKRIKYKNTTVLSNFSKLFLFSHLIKKSYIHEMTGASDEFMMKAELYLKMSDNQ